MIVFEFILIVWAVGVFFTFCVCGNCELDPRDSAGYALYWPLWLVRGFVRFVVPFLWTEFWRVFRR